MQTIKKCVVIFFARCYNHVRYEKVCVRRRAFYKKRSRALRRRASCGDFGILRAAVNRIHRLHRLGHPCPAVFAYGGNEGLSGRWAVFLPRGKASQKGNQHKKTDVCARLPAFFYEHAGYQRRFAYNLCAVRDYRA